MKQIVGQLCLVLLLLLVVPLAARADQLAPTGGELRVLTRGGPVEQCPLKHTDVVAEITGNVAQVEVTQTFQNPYDRKIEAVYVFPLPDRAAVNDMEIKVGERTIKGLIKKKEEARAMYETARQAGHVAALLDQERPNIFTQSVANILPGREVVVTIRYFETVPYASGDYEFSFPMVVGPRFIPGDPTTQGERGLSPDTTEVPDASRITPPGIRPETRTGHDISLEVRLDAGATVRELVSPTHQIRVESNGRGGDIVRLKDEDSIPNRDFVLRYRVDGDAPNLIVLPHRGEGDGYFLMLVQPEANPSETDITPKEMIFVVDCSGSMSGEPIEKVKEAMRYALQGLDPRDTFQIVRFSERAKTFEPAPVLATPGNIERALQYVARLSGEGGTIMLEGVKTALSYPEDPERLRIVSFMTDGYIGNEEAILAYMSKHLGGARLFSFGVGTSVNRYLLDKMADFGHGAVKYVLPGEDSGKSIRRFYDRIRSPHLTDIQIDWGGLGVTDMYPREIPDLFLGQPVAVYGRYGQPGTSEVILRARLGGKPYEQRFTVELPDRQDEGEAIGTLWARARIEDLSDQLIVGSQPALVEEITRIALAHRLVSKYTSFVAVEEQIDTGPENPALVEVPVCTPPGVKYDMTYAASGGVELAERVRVAAQGDVVNADSTTTSTVFNSEFIEALPILGRNYQDVLTLAPGVSDVDGDGNPTIHGSRDTDVITLVDGVSTNDPLTGKRGQEINIDSIQEIEVMTAGATAEFGRGEGGFVTLVTKSGGNEFEGKFSFYWRGKTFDGDGAGIDDPKLHGGLGELGLRDLKFNDFTPFLSLGGPIKKDKAWYYFTAEYIQIQEPVNALTQAFVRPTTEKRVFGKLSWDMSTNHKLQFTATWDPQEYGNLGVDSFTAVEAGYTEMRGGLNLTLKETAVFNPNVFLETTVQHFATQPQTIPTLNADTNHNGVLFIDRNHNGFIDATERDPGEDYDRDGAFDIFEDINHDRHLGPGEDRDLDGRLTAAGAGCEGVHREDVDCDGHVDLIWEDDNNNHQLDPGEDRDADGRLDYIDEDLNHNGILDPEEDRNGNGHLDTFDPHFASIHPYIEDRNGNQNLDDRSFPSRLDPDPFYPYDELTPIPRDRDYTIDQQTLRTSGPNAGAYPGVRGYSDYTANEGRITLREDLTVFVPDWHGQHDMKFGGVVERETYNQDTNLRPVLLPHANPPTANTIQPRIGVILPAENQVFNNATSTSFGIYAVDTFKPLPNLTLGMGLRFDREATDSFGYLPFDPIAQRNLYDRLNALGGGERALDDKLLGNDDGLQSWGYCADPLFYDRGSEGNACDHPRRPLGIDPNYDSIAQLDQDLLNLNRVAPSRLTQHHTATTLAAASLKNLFPEAVRIDPVTGDEVIDREVLRERGAATFQEQEAFRLTNNNLAPRVSVSWDPWADSKTRVFANWGRYYDRLFLDTVIPEEGPDTIQRYYITDENGVTGAGVPDNGIGNPISKAPPSATQVDRGLQTPFSDELTVGFERELAPEISIKLTYINRKYRDQLQDRDINHSLRFDDTTGQPLDEIGGLLQSSGGGGGTSAARVKDNKPDLYIHNFFFNQIYFLSNINSARYHGIELQLTKRLSRKWQMDASYTYSRNLGFADAFYSRLGDDPATVPYTFGYQTDDQRHVVKFSAVTFLPHDWQVGGTAQWTSGLPYSVISFFSDLDNFDFQQTRFLYGHAPDTPSATNPGRAFEPSRRNDQRNDPVLLINLHADKAFVLGKMNWKLFFDIQNLLNRDYLRIFTYEPASPDRGGALQVISERDFGRRFQIGFQVEF